MPVEVARLQFVDTVGEVLVMVQRQIPMVHDEVVSLMSHERVQQRTVEPIIRVPVLQILQEGANEIEVLQFQVCANSQGVQGKYSGKAACMFQD